MEQGRRVLISGGRDGLGLALAKQIASDGDAAEIYILGESPESLESARREIEQMNASVRVVARNVDVMDFGSLEREVEAIGGSLDMLVCVHKFSVRGLFSDLTPEAIKRMVDFNVLGVLHVVKAALPHLHQRKNGKRKSVVALVSSQAAQDGLYGNAVFSATQCSLQGLGEVLQQELFAQGIQVSVAYPPPDQEHVCNQKLAKGILQRLEAGRFNISCGGLYGHMLRIVNAGMTPQPSVYNALLEIVLMGALRLVGLRVLCSQYREICALQNQDYSILRQRVTVKGSRVLITGGSSGIGLALAKCFATEGARVWIMARDARRLELARQEIQTHCGEQSVETVRADVTDYEQLREAVKRLGRIDILVCSHGLAVPGKLTDATVEGLKLMTDTNLLGTMNVIHAALPSLKTDSSHRRSCIAVLSSQAGQVGVFGYAGYSATKFALRAFTQALHKEIFIKNIQVSVVYPPDTQTPGFDRENVDKPELTKALSSSSGVMDPMEVASKSLKGIKQGKFNIACNLEGMLLGMVTAGMSWQPSTSLALAEAALMPFLRLFALWQLFQWYRMIANFPQCH